MRLSGPEDMGADVAAEQPFGPYLVYERLGVGGMATVHRALERGIEGFERIVALKRLLPHLALDATFIKSFVREAKLASLLNHVNIVQIFELGRVGNQYFISMEYIDGRDIRQILRHARKVSGPPPIHVTVGLLIQLCEALEYAHHKLDDAGHPMGLVHRDVSPSNVLVTHAGQVKVIDFGIAKAQSAQLRTQTGRVKGKLAYMAPEALAGKDLDARSDLFAAGVIAHELLTARPLFASKNEYQTLMKVQCGEVRLPSTSNQTCPPELDAIVLRALARDPDHRFSGAGELRDELHALRKQYSLPTADRDIASWLDWAFQPEATGHATGQPEPERGRKRAARPRRQDDDEEIELAWGNEDHGNGEPVLLDDVPDVSDKHLQSASALGAEVRLDLDDLADDIPTPLPSHGRPTVDLAARTATAPQLPRHIARKPAAARTSRSVSAQRAADGPTAAPLAPAPAPAGDDGKTTLDIPPIVPAVHSALAPSRVRTITMPPRAVPSGSVAPRTASATLPPRVPLPATAERLGSSGVPLPAAPSRSGAIASDRSRSAPVHAPAAPSRTGPVVAPPGAEPSHAIPVAVDPPRSYVGPRPSRSPSATLTPPHAMPTGSVTPRVRRPTSPGTVAPPNLTSPSEPVIRDTLLDLTSTDRTPAFHPDELGLAADTMPALPAMPAMDAAQTSESVVRFRPPSSAPANAAPAAAATTSPSPPAPQPPAIARAEMNEAAAHPAITTTHRQRLITPATALFAEPEPDGSAAIAATTSLHGGLDAPPVARRRIPLGRVLIVVLCLVLVSAATTAAGLYLTSTPDAASIRGPSPPPPRPEQTLGTVHVAVAPVDATITITGKSIDGKREHRVSPWDAELPAGGYQIEVNREGYKSLLTSIDVVAGQRQSLPVVLEPLGAAVITEATLVVDSPAGLDITIDGVAFGRTPSRLSITAGHHVVALRAADAEVWHQDIEVRVSTVYEAHPVIAPPPPAAGSPAGAETPSGAPPAPPANPGAPAATGSAAPAPAAEAGALPAPPAAPAPAPVAPPAESAPPPAPP